MCNIHPLERNGCIPIGFDVWLVGLERYNLYATFCDVHQNRSLRVTLPLAFSNEV